MILRFLFWNIRSRPIETLIASCAAEQSADVVMLTECGAIAENLKREFHVHGRPGFAPDVTGSQDSQIRVFSRFPLHSVFDDANNHVAIRRLIVERRRQLLLIVLHLQSKRNWRDSDQLQGAARLARTVFEYERQFTRAPALVVGDLNEASGIPTSYYWNIFDQVLVRPALVDKLKDVRIIDKIGGRPLLDRGGIPDVNVGSDHLPLVFTLDLDEV